MEYRKLQVVGNRSFAVSLPKQWIVANGLQNHDKVFVEVTDNNQLVISKAHLTKRPAKKIDIAADHKHTILEFLVFCYIKNIDHIRLHAKELSYETVKSVRNALKYLEGYDIVHESKQEIQISFLFNEVSITLPQLLRRMIYLLKLEVEAIKNNDPASIEESELATDRLYYLSQRILFASLRDQALRAANNVRYDEDIFFHNNICKRLEHIGDQLFKLKGISIRDADAKHLDTLLAFTESILSEKAKPEALKQEYLKLEPHGSTPAINTVIIRVHELAKDVLDARLSILFNDMMHAM